jgi:thiamine biosynthesis lipoprotein
VGLENPLDFQQVIGMVEINGESVCGSAGNRRKWQIDGKEFHHIIDPVKSEPVSEVLATWVVADSAGAGAGSASDVVAVCA